MNEAFRIGAVAIDAQQQALEVIADNLANMNSTGFKRANVHFSSILTAEMVASENGIDGSQFNSSTAGVSVRKVLSLTEPGDMQVTGNALDIAIDGEGFIEVMGTDGNTLLWRGGRLTVPEDGFLSNADGYQLRDAISVPVDAKEISIGADGVVTVLLSNNETLELGRLTVVSVDNLSSVSRIGGGLYQVDAGTRVTDISPYNGGRGGEIRQGVVELSNVNLNEEMVRMMVVQRAYAANAQVLQTADQIASIVNDLKR